MNNKWNFSDYGHPSDNKLREMCIPLHIAVL